MVVVIHQDKAHFLDHWGIGALVCRGDSNPAQTITKPMGQRTGDVVADLAAGSAMPGWLDLLAVVGRS